MTGAGATWAIAVSCLPPSPTSKPAPEHPEHLTDDLKPDLVLPGACSIDLAPERSWAISLCKFTVNLVSFDAVAHSPAAIASSVTPADANDTSTSVRTPHQHQQPAPYPARRGRSAPHPSLTTRTPHTPHLAPHIQQSHPRAHTQHRPNMPRGRCASRPRARPVPSPARRTDDDICLLRKGYHIRGTLHSVPASQRHGGEGRRMGYTQHP
ncbi:hypothetical protein B0H17DRAFT_1197397 [Mycena rosella]|uniref:Uncharacterized protein n=1 Tax=Mycena rosella TaxID=1033263 RepID=A0AAD7GJ92_MYCRO|nr:hypothetical protein B0H17DRAFT_1197397 [Mycena rosella]